MTIANVIEMKNADGRAEKFGSDDNGHIIHQWETAPSSGNFVNWEKLGSAQLATNMHVAVNADGRLEVFTLENENVYGGNPFHIWQKEPNGGTGWSSWVGFDRADDYSYPLYSNGLYVAQSSDGRLELFGISASAVVVHVYQGDHHLGAWSRWESVSASAGSAKEMVSVALGADGFLKVTFLNFSSQQVVLQQTSNGWT